jgi:hypothetical protein
MNRTPVNGEILPLNEWHRRFPNVYILYEGLNYTEHAPITQSRLLAHGPDREHLIALQESFLDNTRTHVSESSGSVRLSLQGGF